MLGEQLKVALKKQEKERKEKREQIFQKKELNKVKSWWQEEFGESMRQIYERLETNSER